MRHDTCLNVHYSAPKEIWNLIGEVYSSEIAIATCNISQKIYNSRVQPVPEFLKGQHSFGERA